MKNTVLRRILCLFCVAALLCSMLLGLTACGEKPPAFTPQSGVNYTQALDAMNRQVMTGLSGEIPDITWWGAVGKRIVVCGRGAADADSGERPWMLADIDPEGESYASMSLTLPAVGDDLPGIRAALENPDTAHDLAAGYDLAYRNIAAVLEDSAQQVYLLVEDVLMHYGQEAGVTTAAASERALTLCNLSADGVLQPLARLQLPEEYALLPSVAETTLLDAGGGLWLTADDLNGQAALLRFSLTDGSLLAALPLPAGSVPSADCLAQTADGRLLVLAGGQGQTERACLAVEDPAGDSPAWSDQPPVLPQQLAEGGFALAFLPQQAGNSLLVRSDSGIWRWDVSQGTASEELTWDGYGIDRLALAAVFAIDGGRYLAVTQPQDGSACELRILTRLDPTALSERKVITFAKQTCSLIPMVDCIQDVIDLFNATSKEYYIEVVDYTVPLTGTISSAQIKEVQQRLQQDIVNGNMPDVVMLSSISMGPFVGSATACLLNKDIFVDLYSYIDADPNLSREDFLPNILQSTEKDGALPTILPSFCVRTAAGSNRDVAADTGLTMEDYDALRAVNPAVFPNSERGDVLQDILQCAGAQFVDWQAGQAHFDTPAFVHLLEATATLPSFDNLLQSTPDLRGLWQAGNPALLAMNITDWNALATPQDLFGEEWTLTGFPSDQATGRGSAIVPRLQFGISSTCEDPDGAWAFLRLFLLPQFQQKLSLEAGYEGFPLRQDALQRAAGQPHVGYSQLTANGDAVAMTLSGQTVDRFLALVGELDTLWNTEPDLFAIVTEEAEAYYNGQRSAEEAAEIIQNRVQTYLDEQG